MLWHREVKRPGHGAFLVLCSHRIFSAGDFFMRRSITPAGIAVTMLVASFAAANAQQPMQRVQIGILECRGGSSVGFIVGSVTNLGCVLRADGMPDDRYVATIRKVGIDLGITQESTLAWGVFAPSARLGPGDLSGDYAGAQGSASIGVGVGGNVLVGGSNNSIALQPLSLEGNRGLNVAAGIGAITLTPAGRQVALGDRPLSIASSPDGRTLLVGNDGQSTQSLMVIDRQTGSVQQTIPYPAPEALFLGMVFSPDGTHVFASAGGNNKIRTYDVGDQQLVETAAIPLPTTDSEGKKINPYPAGLAISADGATLFVANNLDDSL